MKKSTLYRKQRQLEGIAAKKARGEWDDYGRPRVMPLEEFRKEYQRVLSGECKPTKLMQELNLSKSTFYRYRNELLAK